MKKEMKLDKFSTEDWNKIHRHIESSESRLQEIFDPKLDQKNKIFKKRAMVLAQEIDQKVEREEKLNILEFFISKEKYAVEIQYITKVFSLQDLTPLPGVPTYIIGVINVHGRIIPVVDLKIFFDLPIKDLSANNKVIVLEVSEACFGILIDELYELVQLPISKMQTSLPTLSGIRGEYLKGITNDQVVVLDPIKLSTDKRIMVNDEI